MAVTAFTKGYKMTQQNDVLNQAQCGHPNSTGRYICRVTAISVVSTGGAGAVTVAADGTGGPVILNVTMVANDTASIVYSQPQDIADLALTSATVANLSVLVHLA